ncbi:MAG TPA: hypothetical protein VM243_16750 [Phycisphaerae bacterium]|nr:hypothetical protein [Phycisphaerae bacterium]
MQAATPNVWSGPTDRVGALDASRPRVPPTRRRSLPAIGAIALMCLCTYAPTIHQRAHYSDDFPNRLAVEQSNWWGACREYWSSHGLLRPLGLAAVLICQQALWEYPIAQQAVMLALCLTLCLLVYLFALRVTGDWGVALAAGAILAAWPSYTSMVVWVAGGLEMLPAYCTALAALLLYLRYLGSSRTRSWWFASLAVFAVSVNFHDQHLGTAAAFSLLACLGGPPGRRLRVTLGTVPFWLVALTAGLTTMTTARGTERPLDPTVTSLVSNLGVVLWSFFDMSVLEPFRQSLYGAGPRESLSRMAAADPILLIGCSLLLAAAVAATVHLLRRLPPASSNGRSLAVLAAVGAVIVLAGMGIMALQQDASIKPRHTLVPAIGLAMVLASAVGVSRGPRARTVSAAVLGCLLLVLSVFQLGYVYEWTTRARVTDQVLTSLDEVYPAASEGDLLVIDGVRKYGRGFTDSWGVSGALSLRREVPVRVATLVRRDGDRLYANAAWDRVWEIEPAATRFFLWREGEGRLLPLTYEQFLARRPDLAPQSH